MQRVRYDTVEDCKFEEDEKVKLNPAVVRKFYELLSDEELNNNDMAKEVRTSPRRWEQLLLYINASIPPQSQKEADGLISNVKLKQLARQLSLRCACKRG